MTKDWSKSSVDIHYVPVSTGRQTNVESQVSHSEGKNMSNQSKARSRFNTTAMLSAGISVLALSLASTASAQDSGEEVFADEIIVSGIRQSLETALIEKRNADSLVEVIQAEDIGKLPDQNLAEVLENITGIQITRTAGVGTGVQIRGSNANRVEINGVATVGSGSGRNGISFEDLNAAIISSVEVIKASEASTIEGSVGGTINLRTIRPLALDGLLANVRIQGEDSSLSTEGISPRISGAIGNNWTNARGQEFGFVVSGSFAEQEAVSFRPRADRDNVASPPGATPSEFLGIQFLVQEQENFDFETINLAGTIEAKVSDSTRIYVDGILNDQQRSQDSYRLQASGVSSLRQLSIPTAFETVDFGVGPGQFPAALTGTLEPDLDNDDDDPNLRFSSDTGSRVTETYVVSGGVDWEKGPLNVELQLANTGANTENPNLSTTLNFINPGCPLDGTSNDNCVPFRYDLSGDSLSFDVNFDSPFAPDPADLLDPNNVVLDQVNVGRNTTENQETAFRADITYDFTEGDTSAGFLSSIDLGYRFNEASSEFDSVQDRIGGFSRMVDSPNGSLFSELLVAGPNNFGDADGRALFIDDFLLVDPDLAFSDPQRVIRILQNAVIRHDPESPDILNLRSDQNSFYNINEKTNAFYAQANFDFGVLTGNVGARYIDTEIDSVGFGPEDNDGNRSLQTTSGSYDFILPRVNLSARPIDDVVLRASYGEDIRRPGFNSLSTGFTFNPVENGVVNLGNPGLEPEKVNSFDVSAAWYFAPASVISIGYFNKKRTNIFGQDFDGARIIDGPTQEGFVTTGGFARETDPSCPGGGIFNPTVVPNQLGDPNRLGLCVDFTQPGNDPASTTQQGIEVAFQSDLSMFEDTLGPLSGLGVIANYTYQDFSGGSIVDSTSGRGFNVLGDVSIPRGLLDFSKNAYNLTGFYEKYGLSARVRYTWREGFRTQDFGGGANTSGSSTFSFPVNTLDRGQLNASLSYDVTDQLTVGVEGVNLTEERIIQKCVSETGPTCFVGYPDRRVIFGASYTF
jgi:TonB-dependent receptor